MYTQHELRKFAVSVFQNRNIFTELSPELPSVSLLQKTPSSPVSCLATGFYPHRASLVWRKDGEELHEEVDHGEILPNHDGTFQMSVDLKLSSVTPEDWTRYDCVFQLSGVKEEIITRLEKDRIRTNEGKSEIRGHFVCYIVGYPKYCTRTKSVGQLAPPCGHL